MAIPEFHHPRLYQRQKILQWPRVLPVAGNSTGTIGQRSGPDRFHLRGQFVKNPAKSHHLAPPYLRGALDNEGFTFRIISNCKDPALTQSVEVRYKDSMFTSFDDILDAIKPDRELGYGELGFGTFDQSIVSKHELRYVIRIPWKLDGREIYPDLGNVAVTLCYCSVLKDCWIIEYPSGDRRKGEFKAEVEFED